MTTTINASTSSGLVNTADTSGILQLQTANTAAVTIDASQRVGVTATSPRRNLEVAGTIAAPTALATAITTSANGTIVVADTGGTVGSVIGTALNGSSYDTYIQARNMGAASTPYNLLLQPLGGVVGIGTNSPVTYSPYVNLSVLNGVALGVDSSNAGRIVGSTTTGTELSYLTMGGNYNLGSTGEIALATATSKTIIFGTNGTERMRISPSAANLILAGGTTTATGTGITFPASQSASPNANCLDDYEEGTWTPTINMASGTSTGSSGNGTYIKIGRQVTVTVGLAVGTISAGGEINTIGGLPFTVQSGNDQPVGLSRENALTGFGWEFRASAAGNDILVRKVTDNSATISTGMVFIGTVTYFVP